MACNRPVVTMPFGELVRMFHHAPGMHWASPAEDFQQAVRRVLKAPSAETRVAVTPYDKGGLAAAVWERLGR